MGCVLCMAREGWGIAVGVGLPCTECGFEQLGVAKRDEYSEQRRVNICATKGIACGLAETALHGCG